MMLGACNNRQDPDVIDRDTYKEILKEIILANTSIQQLKKKDSSANKLIGLIYKKYHVDSIQLKKTTDYYSGKPEILVEIYQEIKDEFSHKKDSLQKLVTHDKVITDSIRLPEDVFKKEDILKKH